MHQKPMAHALKSCGTYPKNCGTFPKKLWHITCPEKLRHMPQKVVVHALKSCGTYLEKLWHMPQEVVAHAPESCSTCPEKLWHMPSEGVLEYCVRTRVLLDRAANSIEFYSSSSSTYFSKSEFKFEFSNLIFTSSSPTKIIFFGFKFEFRQRNMQNRDNFFTARVHANKKIKI